MPTPLRVAEPISVSDERRLGRLLHLEIPEVWLRFLLAIMGLVPVDQYLKSKHF